MAAIDVRKALVAACAVLGVSGPTARATEIETAVLGYTEPSRVSALEAVTDLRHAFADGKEVNFRLVLDALTGASASGATPSSRVQVFTRPSGSGSYQTAPSETPLDDTFRDTRVALSGGYAMPLGRVTTWDAGLYGSTEHDYTSLGVNTSLARDFDKRNTSVAVRAAYFDDTINPEGGRPEPFGAMQPAGQAQPRLTGDGAKQTLDLGVSLTQVVDRKTVVLLDYTFSQVDGYQTDPYKFLSLVDPVTGDPGEYLFENRPDARNKHIAYGRFVRHLGRDNLRLSYRLTDDDWNVTSHTVELHYRWNLGAGHYLEPHGRYYTQTAADFYRRYLVTGSDLPQHASADYRLGDMQAYTAGLLYGRPVGDRNELTVRFEYYWQTGESHPADAIGVLRDYDLFPTVDAFIVQVGYSLRI
ncbi:MAG TPA: DUF3570 domain-containing protein [Candidatus Krumholzibacteria bacterium]|nr:DUF3570 domain-containing protein [Candidatus Krumholzibacteria bacterium]HPD71912.1 DUF3570 domain-containing protein [Candidatus Krumholzibacteria bacterium]HRY41155.1 DUF3570 domain-containing protein [Candidatus Krumholzibacteria bacterium]